MDKKKEELSKSDRILMAQQELLKPTTMWLLFLFFGWSYGSMGQMGKQLLYWFTLQGVLVWFFIRLFTLSRAIKAYNNKIYAKWGLEEGVQAT